MDEKLAKRVKAHATTVGIWLAPTVDQKENETLCEWKTRLISLGAEHVMKEVNAPLLRAVLGEVKDD